MLGIDSSKAWVCAWVEAELASLGSWEHPSRTRGIASSPTSMERDGTNFPKALQLSFEVQGQLSQGQWERSGAGTACPRLQHAWLTTGSPVFTRIVDINTDLSCSRTTDPWSSAAAQVSPCSWLTVQATQIFIFNIIF